MGWGGRLGTRHVGAGRCAGQGYLRGGAGGKGDVDIGDDGGRHGLAGAAGLEALELVEGAIEGPLKANLVAGEVRQGVGLDAIFAIDLGQRVRRFQAFIPPVELLLRVYGIGVEETGLRDTEAAETPGGHDDAVDQFALEGIEWREMVAHRVEQGLEISRVIQLEDGLLRRETVTEGVEGGVGFALGGLGAGAELCVAAIGRDLFRGGHTRVLGGGSAGWMLPTSRVRVEGESKRGGEG